VAVRNERPPMTPDIPRELAKQIELSWHPVLLFVIYLCIY